MPFGPDNPVWVLLREALHDAVFRLDAHAAAVLDESNDIWCTWPTAGTVIHAANRFFEGEIAHRSGVPLRRGGKLAVCHPGEKFDDSYLAVSFSAIYVVVIWFKGPFDPAIAKAKLRRELGRIEALTLALPPPDGPEEGGAAGKMRA